MSAPAKVYIPAAPADPPPKKPKKSRGRRRLYTKAAKTGRRSREKGAEAEREVVALAKEHGFSRAERAAPMQAATGDERHPDVANVGRLWIEVKRRGRGSMYALAVEATRERPGFIPTLAYREDRGPWLAVVPLDELLKLERVALACPPSSLPPVNGWDAYEQAERSEST